MIVCLHKTGNYEVFLKNSIIAGNYSIASQEIPKMTAKQYYPHDYSLKNK